VVFVHEDMTQLEEKMEKKETIVEAGEEQIWIVEEEELDVMGDRILTAFGNWCKLGDPKCFYIKKVGHHLEVGKAEVEYKFTGNHECIAKAVCMV